MNTTNAGITVKQRDIVLIPFPYTDLSKNKKRPAAIISGSEYNTLSKDFICCAVTSNPNSHLQDISINNLDLEEGNLMFNSKVKPYKVFTLNQQNIIKKIGKLNLEKSKEIVKRLNTSIKIEE